MSVHDEDYCSIQARAVNGLEAENARLRSELFSAKKSLDAVVKERNALLGSEDAITTDVALGIAARVAYSTYLAMPVDSELYNRMCAPRVGDIVLEISAWRGSWRKPRGVAGASFGILTKECEEPVSSAQELEEMHAAGDCWHSLSETVADIPKERVVYVRSLVNLEQFYRWRNCNFIAVSNLNEAWMNRAAGAGRAESK